MISMRAVIIHYTEVYTFIRILAMISSIKYALILVTLFDIVAFAKINEEKNKLFHRHR